MFCRSSSPSPWSRSSTSTSSCSVWPRPSSTPLSGWRLESLRRIRATVTRFQILFEIGDIFSCVQDVCLFGKEKPLDFWVMKLPMLIVLSCNTTFLVWIITVRFPSHHNRLLFNHLISNVFATVFTLCTSGVIFLPLPFFTTIICSQPEMLVKVFYLGPLAHAHLNCFHSDGGNPCTYIQIRI